VHFPTDVAAGQKLGRDICAHLLRDENFKARLRECNEKGKCPQNSEHAL
jgi:hypothetical protein